MSVAELIEGVHHTALCVRDFEAMRDFLTKFLGFEVEGEIDKRAEPALQQVVGLPDAVIRWGLLRLESHRVELFHYYHPDGADAPLRQCDTGYTHIAFRVSDVDAVHARAVHAGYTPFSTPQEMRGGATKAFYMHGPEGVAFEFIEFPKEAH